MGEPSNRVENTQLTQLTRQCGRDFPVKKLADKQTGDGRQLRPSLMLESRRRNLGRDPGKDGSMRSRHWLQDKWKKTAGDQDGWRPVGTGGTVEALQRKRCLLSPGQIVMGISSTRLGVNNCRCENYTAVFSNGTVAVASRVMNNEAIAAQNQCRWHHCKSRWRACSSKISMDDRWKIEDDDNLISSDRLHGPGAL